ncbi:MAG: hypothetical protein ACYDC0_16265 [Acidimicrobiales bacterium]
MTWGIPVLVAVIAATPGALIAVATLRATATGNGRKLGRMVSDIESRLKRVENFIHITSTEEGENHG